MVRALIVILILTLPVVAVGQDVVKVNILEIAGKIPPPPKDVKDAFSRTAEHKEGGGTAVQRDADAYFKPVGDRLEATDQQIQKAVEILSKPQIDAAKEMDQKEMQKKFKSMSQEEQMKMAMEMSKKMGMTPGAMTRESDAVMAAQQECNKITQEISNDIQKAQAGYAARQKTEGDRDAKHKEIETWQEEQEKKLPQVSYGEMGGPEPKAEYALLTKAMQKHLDVENEYLKAVQKEWKETWEKYRTRYSPLQEMLEKIRYGEDAKNPTTRRQLLGGQGSMLSSTADLVGLSRTSTKDAAQWWERKLELEKNKPKD